MQQESLPGFVSELAMETSAASASGSRSAIRTVRSHITPTRIALAGISALSLFLGLYNISQEGYGNSYYAAAVRSMLQNWHAFFFASFDSQGFVTVDKPPAGLWIQTASAWLFGFHGWSVLLPQAVAGVVSVLLVYNLVRRGFGQPAGLIAAFALAIAPINVAVARNNTADDLLICVLLLGATCLMRAVSTGRLLWLMGAMAFVGIGFNIKMMEAYLVLPAFLAVYILSTTVGFWRRVWHLAVSGLVLLGVSFSWAIIVALTPASQRPYVGSTQDNSIFSLIFGYNGINRLLPKGWSIFGITSSSLGATTTTGFGGGGGGVGGASENGAQGVFRLLDSQLAGQIGWLIPLALVGMLAAWGRPRLRKLSEQQLLLVLFGGWAIVEIVFFSVAGFYHRYYLSTLSPAIAALTGIGLVALWSLFRAGGRRSTFLPAAIVLAAASQYRILRDYPVWRDRLGPVLMAGAAVCVATFVIFLALSRKQSWINGRTGAVLRIATMAGVLTLFAGPAVWSYTTTSSAGNTTLPVAGPASTSATAGGFIGGGGSRAGARFAQGGGPGETTTTDTALIKYLNANKGDAAYLLAVTSSQEADQIIIATGEAVMSMGGFSGSDPILTVDSLKALVASGKVRFFETSGRGGFGGGGIPRSGSFTGGERPTDADFELPAGIAAPSGATDAEPPAQGAVGAAPGGSETTSLTSWITSNCKVVSSAEIAAASSSSTSTTTTSGLYDCQGAAS